MSDIAASFDILRPDLEKFEARLTPAKAGRFQIKFNAHTDTVHLTCGRTHHQTLVSSNHDKVRSLRVMHRVAQFADALTCRLRCNPIFDHDHLVWSIGFAHIDNPRLTLRLFEMKVHSSPITPKGLECALDTLSARLPSSRPDGSGSAFFRVETRLIGARSPRDALALWQALEKARDTQTRPKIFHPLWDPERDLRDEIMPA